MTAYVLARRWRPLPIYEALLEQDGIVIPNAVSRYQPLEQLSISGAMTPDTRGFAPGVSIGEAAASLYAQTMTVVPVVDGHGRLSGVVLPSDLRRPGAPPDAPVTTVLRPAHTIRADASPVAALVSMNELGARQLLVVDDQGRLVGVLAMGDIVRTLSRGVPVRASPRAPSQALGRSPQPSRLTAKAVVVDGATRLPEVAARMRDARCIIVRTGAEYGVVLASDLSEVARDEDLERMLIAADLAQAAPCVLEDATTNDIVRAIGASRAVAAIVVPARGGDPVGVVTREALGQELLDWFVANGMPTA
jgi:CBS domain-containing protein